MPTRFVLASASPRRKELLALVGLPFEVIQSGVDEEADPLIGAKMLRASTYTPRELAGVLAWQKAFDVWCSVKDGDVLVLGADTVVVTDRPGLPTALGKPKGAEDARRMLALLSGTTHTVYTGVSLMWNIEPGPDYEHLTEVVDTQVQFRELTPEMIEAYIATGEPFDKAGAYGIQGYASLFVEAVYGDYFNVVGLPVSTVALMLEKIGIRWWESPASLNERPRFPRQP